MKVHVTLLPEVRNDPEAKKLAVARVAQTSGIRNVNLKRSERYGIISGDIDPDKLADLEKLDEVKTVEVDGRKTASGPE